MAAAGRSLRLTARASSHPVLLGQLEHDAGPGLWHIADAVNKRLATEGGLTSGPPGEARPFWLQLGNQGCDAIQHLLIANTLAQMSKSKGDSVGGLFVQMIFISTRRPLPRTT
jgi:hypothetical protein